MTWTLNRVLKRLERAQLRGNQGDTMRDNQMKMWLQGCLCHLHGSTAEERSRMWNSLTSDGELSESDSSPTYNLGEHERSFLIQSHGEMHRCLVKFLEFERLGTTMDLLRVFANAFKSLEPAPESSDESIPEELKRQDSEGTRTVSSVKSHTRRSGL